MFKWLGTTLILFAGFLFCLLGSCGHEEKKETEVTLEKLEARPPYIDPTNCRSCHETIVNQFLSSGKGRSFYPASKKYSIENWKTKPVRDAASNFFYLPFQKDSTFYVLEFRLEGTDTSYKRTEKIDFFIGSGNQTRSYLFQRNGYLFEIPVTWYSKKKIWDLSPGYENGQNLRFDREIGEECMFCHNSGFDPVANSVNRYSGFGHATACESCHGNVENHWKSMQHSNGKSGKTEILALKNVPVQARLDVCRQCHLEGIKVKKKNAKPGEYQPGKLLADYFEVFIPTKGESSDFGFASHAERLQQSKCFIGSEGKMTCVSCHDPHGAAPSDKLIFYNSKCRNCHAEGHEKSCSRVKEVSKSDCKSCHMQISGTTDIPHVSSTDHWIRKNIKKEIPKDSNQLIFRNFAGQQFDQADLIHAKLTYAETNEKGNLFEEIKHFINLLDNEQKLKFYYLSHEEWQNNLDTSSFGKSKNPWTVFYWSQLKIKAGMIGGISELEKACDLAPSMIEFQYKLATVYDQNQILSLNQYQKILNLNPFHEKSLTNLGFSELVSGNYGMAEKYFLTSFGQNPDYVLNIENLVRCYMEQGKFQKAKPLLTSLIKQFPQEMRYQKVMETLP